jgi:hypothetical protein
MLRLPALASASFTVSSIRGPAALIAARPTVRGAAGSAGVRMLEEEDIPEAFKGASKRKPPNPEVQIIDREGDECRFILEDGELRLYVQGELFCEAIENMSYSREEGRIFIEDEEVEGSFQIREGEEMMKAAQLAVFGRQCGAPPVQPGTAPHRSAGGWLLERCRCCSAFRCRRGVGRRRADHAARRGGEAPDRR